MINRSQWLCDQCGLWARVLEGSVWWIFTTLGTSRTTRSAPGALCLGQGWPGDPWGGGWRGWGRGAWGAWWARAWGGTSSPNSSLRGCGDWKPPSMDSQSVLQADPSVRHLSSSVQPLAWCSCICSWKVSYKIWKKKTSIKSECLRHYLKCTKGILHFILDYNFFQKIWECLYWLWSQIQHGQLQSPTDRTNSGGIPQRPRNHRGWGPNCGGGERPQECPTRGSWSSRGDGRGRRGGGWWWKLMIRQGQMRKRSSCQLWTLWKFKIFAICSVLTFIHWWQM